MACGGTRVEDSGATQASPPTPPPTSAKAAPVITFMPTIEFREHAAKVLAIPVEDVEGGSVDAADAASRMPETVGRAWAYLMHPKGNYQREVRGWVNAEGTVITADQNLGLLRAEAGVWTKDRKQTDDDVADKLAALLSWSYGYGFKVIDYRGDGMTPPTLTLKPDGSGQLVFFTNYKQSGPGLPGPDDFVEHRVVFKADKSATLTKKKLSP